MKFDADLFFEMEKLTAQHYYISFADVVNLFLKGQSETIRTRLFPENLKRQVFAYQ